MITIEKDRCIGCGQCIQVCPFTVLAAGDDGKAYNTGKMCIACMHCAAVCPRDAITDDGEKAVLEEVRPLSDNCADTVETLIRQRRSYRRFGKKRVAHEDICRILDTADFVPSAKNQHPVHWVVIENESVISRMMEAVLEFCRTTGACPEIIEEYRNGNNPVLGENASILIGFCFADAINPASDTAIALTSIELMMQAEKIGTFWGGYLMRFLNLIPECRKLAGIPENAEVYGTLLFGYARQKEYRYVPERKNRAEVNFI